MDLMPQMPRMMDSTFTSMGRFGPMIIVFIAAMIFIEAFYVVVLKKPGPIFGALGAGIFRDGSGGRRQ